MADGLLTFRGVDLHRGTYEPNSINLDLVGGFDDEAEVRGDDRIMPEAAGRFEGARQLDRRIITLEGFVRGVTSLDYRSLIDELHTIFDPTLSPGTLVVGGGDNDYLGIPSGETRTTTARYLNAVWGNYTRQRFRTVSVVLESIESPPEWIASSP